MLVCVSGEPQLPACRVSGQGIAERNEGRIHSVSIKKMFAAADPQNLSTAFGVLPRSRAPRLSGLASSICCSGMSDTLVFRQRGGRGAGRLSLTVKSWFWCIRPGRGLFLPPPPPWIGPASLSRKKIFLSLLTQGNFKTRKETRLLRGVRWEIAFGR